MGGGLLVTISHGVKALLVNPQGLEMPREGFSDPSNMTRAPWRLPRLFHGLLVKAWGTFKRSNIEVYASTIGVLSSEQWIYIYI